MKKSSKIKLLDLLKKEYANMGGMSKSNHLGGGKFPSHSSPMEPLDHMTNKLRNKDEDEVEESKIGTNHFSGRETDYHSFKGPSKRTYGKTNFEPSNSGQPDVDDEEEKGYLEIKTNKREHNVNKKR